MDIKNSFPEYSDEWVFKYNKDIPLKNQIICTSNYNHLLNVRKIYTNNIYWGVIWTILDRYNEISHNFRCKDRGFSEDFVDNKEAFVNIFINKFSNDYFTTETFSNYKVIKPDFLQEYETKFLIDPNGNYYATTAVINNTARARGLYGATTEKNHQEQLKELGVSIFNRFPTEEEVKFHIIDKHINSLSANYETRVNTEYSQIKVYHKSEI